MPQITVIQPTINRLTKSPLSEVKRRRVCAYARVSTDSDEQFTSYEAQIDYYTKLIQSRPDWDFVEVFSDEGISGTGTKNRPGFNRMIKEALAGKIDLIVTKSVSRFARNTVDSLETIRRLKEKGVECYFQKENIYTFDSKGELLLTIMASLAQEESRSLSENVTWGIRKRLSDGKVSVAYKHFLGFKKGKDGKLEVVPEEAEIVRFIYSEFINGKAFYQIAEALEEKGIKTPSGKKKWSYSTVRSILKNEKYKGDALLQKTYTESFLTHKHVKNDGEVPQYYVKDSHEAIISPEEWDLVQHELSRRSSLGKALRISSAFCNKLICADCGSFLGQKVWHSNEKYKTVIWQCLDKFKNKCETPHLKEEEIQSAFVKAYNQLCQTKGIVIQECEKMILILCDTSSLEERLETLSEEASILEDRAEAMRKENAITPADQEEYRKKYDKLYIRHEKIVTELKAIQEQIKRKNSQKESINYFVENYKKAPDLIKEWDEKLWNMVVEKVIVYKDGKLEFVFFSGTKVAI